MKKRKTKQQKEIDKIFKVIIQLQKEILKNPPRNNSEKMHLMEHITNIKPTIELILQTNNYPTGEVMQILRDMSNDIMPQPEFYQ